MIFSHSFCIRKTELLVQKIGGRSSCKIGCRISLPFGLYNIKLPLLPLYNLFLSVYRHCSILECIFRFQDWKRPITMVSQNCSTQYLYSMFSVFYKRCSNWSSHWVCEVIGRNKYLRVFHVQKAKTKQHKGHLLKLKQN